MSNEVMRLFQHGGIGDQICALPIIEQFAAAGPVRLYTLFPEIVKIFMPNLDVQLREQLVHDNANWWMDLSDVACFRFKDGATNPDILPPFARARYDALHAKQGEWGNFIARHPLLCNEMAHAALHRGLNRRSLPFYLLGLEQTELSFDIENQSAFFQYITVHDGFDSNHKFDVSMKSWPMRHWEVLVAMIRKLYPKLRIIQVGGPKHRVIPGTHQNLAGHLSFENSMRYLKGALAHIDGDSGLVHTRALFKKPSIVIFGPTNPDYFGYPENVNLLPSYCGDCWWTQREWMKFCPKEWPHAMCMDSVTPGHVMNVLPALLKDYS